jgi:hypothetical protein
MTQIIYENTTARVKVKLESIDPVTGDRADVTTLDNASKLTVYKPDGTTVLAEKTVGASNFVHYGAGWWGGEFLPDRPGRFIAKVDATDASGRRVGEVLNFQVSAF